MATRCSTNPPLCLTARYTSIAFQRCSQLSFAVAMIIRSIHFRCIAVPCHSIPFRSNARQRFAFPLLTSAFLCFSIAGQCEAEQVLCFPSLTPASPLRFCARRLFTLPFLCYTLLDRTLPRLRYALLNPTLPLLFRAHRGDSFRYPAIACHCFSILRLRYAKHLPAAQLQHFASLHFSIALPRYASPRKAFAAFHVPKQNSACPMQFLTVRRSTSPLLCLAPLHLALHHFAYPLLC